jgi:hypothetical protein
MRHYVTSLYAVVAPVTAILASHIIGKISVLFGSKPWIMKEHTNVLIMSNKFRKMDLDLIDFIIKV